MSSAVRAPGLAFDAIVGVGQAATVADHLGQSGADLLEIAANPRSDAPDLPWYAPCSPVGVMGFRGALHSRLVRIFAVISLAVGTSGCLVATRVASLDMEIPRDATPIAIEAALRAMNDPANQKRIQQMVATPEMKAVERELVSGMVDGSLAALSDGDRADRIGALTSRYATGMLQGFTREVAPQIGPAVSEVMRSAVRSAMSEAMKPENQVGVSNAFSGAMSTAMTRDLGPALQKVISDNVAPGIAAALEKDEVKRALGETAHLLGREIVLGVNEGMTEIQAAKAKGEPSALGSLESLASLAKKGSNIATGLTWVLVAVVLLLGALVAKLLMQARRYRSESAEQVAATRLMTEARRASEGKPWSSELLAALENGLPKAELGGRSRRRSGVRVSTVAP
ncbi:MAG: hypothetical protein ABJE95_16655 [Byssovorax sp.]